MSCLIKGGIGYAIYDMLCEIEAKQEEKKAGFAPLIELLCAAVIIVEYASILIFALIVTYSRFKEGFFIIDTSSTFSAVNMFFLCIYPVLIFFSCVSVPG